LPVQAPAAKSLMSSRATGTDPAGGRPAKTRVRLSYKEQRELAALPDEIEALEREQAQLTERMSAPDYHRLGGEQLRSDRKRLEELEALLLDKFARWERLEEEHSMSSRRQT